MGPRGFWTALAIVLLYLIARPHVGKVWYITRTPLRRRSRRTLMPLQLPIRRGSRRQQRATSVRKTAPMR